MHWQLVIALSILAVSCVNECHKIKRVLSRDFLVIMTIFFTSLQEEESDDGDADEKER